MTPIRRTLIVAGAIVVMLVVGCLLLLLSRSPIVSLLTDFADQNPGPFDRPAMEAIVNQVRDSGLQPGQREEFTLDNLSDPKSLKPWTLDPQGPHPGSQLRIWAEITAMGSLKVVIETRDFGHAGSYGFAYTDVSLSPEPFGEHWQTLDVPGHLYFFDSKIDDHWWKVYETED